MTDDYQQDKKLMLNVQVEKQDMTTHIELDVPNGTSTENDPKESQQSKQDTKNKDTETVEEDSNERDATNKKKGRDTEPDEKPFTIAGYRPVELLKAPLEPPTPYEDEKKQGG